MRRMIAMCSVGLVMGVVAGCEDRSQAPQDMGEVRTQYGEPEEDYAGRGGPELEQVEVHEEARPAQQPQVGGEVTEELRDLHQGGSDVPPGQAARGGAAVAP